MPTSPRSDATLKRFTESAAAPSINLLFPRQGEQLHHPLRVPRHAMRNLETLRPSAIDDPGRMSRASSCRSTINGTFVRVNNFPTTRKLAAHTVAKPSCEVSPTGAAERADRSDWRELAGQETLSAAIWHDESFALPYEVDLMGTRH